MGENERKKTRTLDSPSEDDHTELLGVSLNHLVQVFQKEPPQSTIYDLCELIKRKTSNLPIPVRSYARFLLSNESTKHLIKMKADVFVSYAWKVSWVATSSALKAHFADHEDVFVWMDFVVLDQNQINDQSNALDFNILANRFRSSLKAIGKAVLVLTPAEKPIAAYLY